MIITLATPLGQVIKGTTPLTLTEQAPRAWQIIDGQRVAVASRFVLGVGRRVQFALGAYDRARPLIIDPTLVYGTTISGSGSDTATDIAVDANGNAYVVGSTSSLTFPGAVNTYTGSTDAFVAKLNPAGDDVLWSTYLGGDQSDGALSVALDTTGAAYITGHTSSNGLSSTTPFPTTSGAYQTTGTSYYLSGFVTKLSSTGSLIYSTYLHHTGRDQLGLAIDVFTEANGSVSAYVGGTRGDENDNDFQDAFVAKLNGSGSALLFNAQLGGDRSDALGDIAVDRRGAVYVVGVTESSTGRLNGTPFPTTAGAIKTSNTGDYFDAFVSKLSSTGSLVLSTFFGGGGEEYGAGVAVDRDGNIAITGNTGSANFPTTSTAYDGSCAGCGPYPLSQTIFVSLLNPNASALRYSTVLGNGNSYSQGIAVDANKHLYVVGNANGSFPSKEALAGANGTPAVAVKIDPARAGEASLIYSTPLLPSGQGYASGIFVPSAGHAYVVGWSGNDTFAMHVQEDRVALGDGQTRGPEDCVCHSPAPQWTTLYPVNTRTGNFSTSVTDLVVQTPGPAISWQRSYASQATAVLTGPLGIGWQYPYGAYLVMPDMPNGQPGVVTVVSGVGNELAYTDIGGGQYQAAPGVYSTLVAGNGVYTQTKQNQTQYIFDDITGQLTAVQDAIGRRVILSYASTPPQLTQIADANDSARFLDLTYTQNKQIETVSDGTRTVTYGYTGDDLTSVTDVENRTTTYDYQNHLLTVISDALSQPVEQMTYDVALPSGKVISQTLQDGRQFQFEYASATTVLTTTGQDGRQTVQQFDYTDTNTLLGVTENGQSVMTSAFDDSFSPAAVNDGNGNATHTTYSQNGLPQAATDPLGQTTRALYNSQNRPISVTNALGITTLWRYDVQGNVLSTTVGITTSSALRATTFYTYTYDVRYTGDSQLSEQSGPDGVVTHYTYDAQGQVETVTVGYGTPSAQTTRYTYDALGRLQITTVGDGTALARSDRTEYNADNTTARSIQNYDDGVFDPLVPDQDIVTTYGYDAVGRRIWVQDTLGRYDVTHYTALGRIDWTVRNLQPISFDGQGQPIIPSTEPAYDPALPDANVTTSYGYDGLGRTTLVTETGILTGTFDTAMRAFSDATNRVTRTEYDALSRPVTVTLNYRPNLPVGASPDINVQTLTHYDGAGNVIWQRDTLGRWTKTDYDALNRPITVTVNYENGDPTTVDPINAGNTDGSDTDLIQVTQYDTLGRVVRTISNYTDGAFNAAAPTEDRITQYAYDTLGRATQTTVNVDPATLGSRTDTNRVTATAYDPITTRVVGQQDTLGRWTVPQYDALGRVTTMIANCRDATGQPTATNCAAFDPQSRTDRNVPSETRYDALGRAFETVDALGHVARIEFDRLGRSMATIQNYDDGVFDSAAPDTDVIQAQQYDARGQRIGATDPRGATTAAAYNALGATTVMTDTMGRVTMMGVDGQGAQRWSATPDGRFTVMQVDGLGRTVITIQNYQDGLVDSSDGSYRDLITAVAYDAAGRRVAATDASGTVTAFGYDLRDLVTSVTENVAGTTCATPPCDVVTQYTYDRVGNRVAIIDANTNTRTFSYNAADEQVDADDPVHPATAWAYDRAGRVVSETDPRGPDDSLSYQYDELDRQTEISATNLGAIEANYDALGRRTALIDASGTTSFEYDALGRPTQVEAPFTGVVGYAYDGAGNRTALSYPNGRTIDYTYWNDGQLDQVSENAAPLASYAYDSVGRLATMQTANGTITRYGYDNADRLRDLRTTVGGATVSRFQYATSRTGQRIGAMETLVAPPEPDGTGLEGAYYDNVDLLNSPVLTRTDALVDFDWQNEMPDAALPSDGFSVRWSGLVVPRYSETYTFYTNADDGVRLWVDGTQLIDDWNSHGPEEHSGTITLTAGQPYTLTLEYYEDVGGAVVQLGWWSDTQPKEIIPQTRLYLPAE